MAVDGHRAGPEPLGTALDRARMSRLHVRFWLLAGLGIMLDGYDFFIIGVANPLISAEFGLSAVEQGIVSAAAIVGAMFGAALLGPLGDRIGRSRTLRIDLWLFVVFSACCVFAWDPWSLVGFRFMLGVAIGLDYPIAASYLAEILPASRRGRWLVSAFSLQAVGIVLGAVTGVVVLNLLPEVSSWRIMLGFGAVPALITIWMRRNVPESPRWLAQNGYEREAREVGEALVGRPVTVTSADRERREQAPEGLRAFIRPQLFSRPLLRRTVLTAVPWFLMDIATYGVGIFTPTLLAALVLSDADTTFLADDVLSTEGTAVLDAFLVVGFLLAIGLVDRLGRIPLQLCGFAMMAVALCVLATSDLLAGGAGAHLGWVFAGFAAFNLFMNLGPNATTFTLPAEVFPSEVRAAGHGFAAGCAKLGAALGTFLFPLLLDDIGKSALLYAIAGTSMLAFAVTLAFRIEPRGRSLGEVGDDVAGLAQRLTPG
jgi:MFS family permease